MWTYESFETDEIIPFYNSLIQKSSFNANEVYGVVYKITNVINALSRTVVAQKEVAESPVLFNAMELVPLALRL